MKTKAPIRVLSPTGQTYDVGAKLLENEIYTLYECRLEDGRICLFKIAAGVSQNGPLDREAFILSSMKQEAAETEREYAEKHPGKDPLNYHLAFPTLVESFESEEDGGRRINILSFFGIADNLGDLVPVSHITEREHLRVDPRTSAWIMGKILKILAFAHHQNIAVGDLGGDNILIHRDGHFIALWDWTEAKIVSAGLSSETKAAEIAEAAQTVVTLLSGDPDDETFAIPPHEEQLPDSRYQDFLRLLAEGHESDTRKAHEEFYELVKSLWPREFHPYTTTRI